MATIVQRRSVYARHKWTYTWAYYLIELALSVTGLGLPISFAGRGQNMLWSPSITQMFIIMRASEDNKEITKKTTKNISRLSCFWLRKSVQLNCLLALSCGLRARLRWAFPLCSSREKALPLIYCRRRSNKVNSIINKAGAQHLTYVFFSL